MDGGSTDETVGILRRYEDRLRFGVGARRRPGRSDQRAFARCRGEIFLPCWLNSDDMYLPGTLLDVGQRMAGRTGEPHLIYGSTINFRRGDPTSMPAGAHVTEPFDRERITYTDPISAAQLFLDPGTLWDATGPLVADYPQCAFDLGTWYIRPSRQCDFERVERFYALYRWHAAQKTSAGGERARRGDSSRRTAVCQPLLGAALRGNGQALREGECCARPWRRCVPSRALGPCLLRRKCCGKPGNSTTFASRWECCNFHPAGGTQLPPARTVDRAAGDAAG